MVQQTPPWRDRFNRPTPDALRGGLEEDALEAFDRVRADLLGLGELSESLGWYGASWCWAIEYRMVGLDEPVAILIPSPEDVQVAMPIDREFMEKLPIRRLKRSIRDGLDLAGEPFDTRWAVWSVAQGGPPADDLADMLKRKHKYVTAPVA